MSQNNIPIDKPLINRVANSGLINLNLEEYFPEHTIQVFDLKEYLFQGLILKEKDFRSALKEHNWDQYENTVLCLYCSTDAIIPMWAYMLVTAYAEPFASDIYFGTKDQYLSDYYKHRIEEIDGSDYTEKRVVIKGCSSKPVPPSAYIQLTKVLRPYAQSIMYGEPCSTVPIFKRPRNLRK